MIDFNALADEFIRRVQAAELTGASEVVLVCHFADQGGNRLPPFRKSMVPRVSVKHQPGNPGGEQIALRLLRDTTIGNIDAAVRHLQPGEFYRQRGVPVPVRFLDIELEII